VKLNLFMTFLAVICVSFSDLFKSSMCLLQDSFTHLQAGISSESIFNAYFVASLMQDSLNL